MKLRVLLEAAYLICKVNPLLLQPVTDMEKRRRQGIGKLPVKPRSVAGLKVQRPYTRRKLRVSPEGHAFQKLIQSRRAKNYKALTRWRNRLAVMAAS